MRTIRTKVYSFSELSKEAQEKAISQFSDINVDYEWWENIYEDAANVGLKIKGFDIDRGSYCKGEFTLSANEVAQNILIQHGESCETYKTAQSFMDEWQPVFNEYLNPDSDEYESLDSENKLQEIEENFLQSICEDYRIILSNEYDYLTSSEAIKETIIANEYEFTIEGNRF